MAKKNAAKLRDSWILCFILGIVMLNYPFLHIFNKPTTYLGIPILVLYFFIGWPISIAVIFLFSRLIDSANDVEQDEDDGDEAP